MPRIVKWLNTIMPITLENIFSSAFGTTNDTGLKLIQQYHKRISLDFWLHTAPWGTPIKITGEPFLTFEV